MLPIPGDNGARLAAILPRAAKFLGVDLPDSLQEQTGVQATTATPQPELGTIIVVLVDGMGYHNLFSASGHARNLAKMQNGLVQTVLPSTTAAAIASITTSVLPGQHGLLGYRLRHRDLGVLNSLSDWHKIADARQWQTKPTFFELAAGAGVNSFAVARPQHADSGFTRAVLTGAKYVGAATIEQRVDDALRLSRQPGKKVIYVYIDELDRAGHKSGWQSNDWIIWLERIDQAVADLLRRAGASVGVLVTADHGMLDIKPAENIVLESTWPITKTATAIGGEPRFRHIYFDDDELAVAARAEVVESGYPVAALLRNEVLESNVFGQVRQEVADRVGNLMLVPLDKIALKSETDEVFASAMVGQHGGLSDAERDVGIFVSDNLAIDYFTQAV